MFPDGVLNEGYFAAPSDADETRAAAEIVTAKARKRLKLRRYMLSSCSIERRIGGTGQAAAKRRQSLLSARLRERGPGCSDGGANGARSVVPTSSRATRTRSTARAIRAAASRARSTGA